MTLPLSPDSPPKHADEESAEAPANPPEVSRTRLDLQRFGCGFVMGAADVVPGVSGGTMALILGIYERLVTAISRMDQGLLRQLADREFAEAARRIDLRFLVALGCGILVGAGGLASVMKQLLTDHRSVTYAAFTGMILVSSLLVARRVQRWNALRIGLLLVAALFAFWLVTLDALKNPPDTYWYLFACGMIGICAMILPGISGAFILLLLSRYETVLTAVKSFLHLEITGDIVLTLIVFCSGCLCGLLAFSRVLRWLLACYHDPTVCVLCGFMLGSLYRLWPFQNDLTPEETDFKHKILEPYIPNGFTSEVWTAIIAAAIAAAAVFALEFVSRDRSPESSD